MSELAPLVAMDVESWKKFVHGQAEPPKGFKADEVILFKDCNAHVIKGDHADLAKREVTIAFSTEGVDRDGDIIRQRGLDFKAFKLNPVVLFAHNGRALPIGRSMKIFQTDNRTRSVSVDRFTPPDLNELGDTVFRMLTHETPFLNAASIGFRPTKFENREVSEGEAQGFFFPTEFIKSEKLEHSIVPVPANAEALVAAKSAGINLGPIKAWAEEMLDMDKAMKDGVLSRENIERCWGIACGGTRSFIVPDMHVELGYDGPFEPTEGAASSDQHKECSCKDEVIMAIKGTTPPNPSGFPTEPADTAWSRLRFRDFEAEGTFEDLSAMRRRAIARHFAWTESMPPDNFGQLKLPHHQASNAAVVLRGVNAALAALNGARGGVDLPDGDRAPANRHLNAHRRSQFDLDPIELRSMEDEEMKELLKRLAAEIADHEGTTQEVAEKALDEAIEEFTAANKAGDGPDAATEPGDYTKEQLEAIVSAAVAKLYEPEDDKDIEDGVDGNDSKDEDSTEGTKDPEAITYKFGDTEMEITSDDFATAVKAAVEALLQSKIDEQKDEDSFEFPSIKNEDAAIKDEVGVQLSELRTGQRTMTELVKKLVETIKVSGEPDVPEPGTDASKEGAAPEKGSDDEVVMVLADDEPENKDGGGPSGTDIGTLIATQTAEAVTAAFAEATGRLPN